MKIQDLLVATHKNKASDLHMVSNNPPIMRVHGDVLPLDMPPMTPEMVQSMIDDIMTEQQREEFKRDLELDFSIAAKDGVRFRVNAFHTIGGPAAVFRAIPAKISTLDDLAAPETIRRLCHLHKGLVLVTGPTGSGKSTTLAAMVDYINANFNKHILTIEDPIEFVHKSRKSLVSQREIGSSTHSFSRALRSALREDPDVVLVGELRDLETIQLAITAAETGHLVLCTLHTSSAAKTIDRIIDVFPSDTKEMVRAMLSMSLEAVIAQTLLKTVDGKGRVAAQEILLGTPAVRNLIREAKVPQITSMIQMGSKVGMVTMRDSINKLYELGVISAETLRDALSSGLVNEEEGGGANSGGAQRRAPGSNSF